MDAEERKKTVLEEMHKRTGIALERLRVLWDKEQEPTFEETRQLANALMTIHDEHFWKVMAPFC